MAFKELDGSQENSESKYQLPTVKEYVRQEIERGNENVYEEALIVEHIETSRNQEWLKLTTNKCVALINIKTKLGENIMYLKNNLRGRGHAMAIIPTRKGKFGFKVGVDDSITRFWEQSYGATIAYETAQEAATKQRELTLADFGIPEAIEALEKDLKEAKRNKKTSESK